MATGSTQLSATSVEAGALRRRKRSTAPCSAPDEGEREGMRPQPAAHCQAAQPAGALDMFDRPKASRLLRTKKSPSITNGRRRFVSASAAAVRPRSAAVPFLWSKKIKPPVVATDRHVYGLFDQIPAALRGW